MLTFIKNRIIHFFGLRVAASHFYIASFDQNPIIVDCGAGNGKFSDLIHKQYPQSRLFLIEPDPLQAKLLERKYNHGHAVIIQKAISDTDRQNNPFYLKHNQECNSLFRHFNKKDSLTSTGNSTITVGSISLPRLINQYHLDRIDLLKIDVEGEEWKILEDLNQQESRIISQITVEFHDFIEPKYRIRTEHCIQKLLSLDYELIHQGTRYLNGSPYYNCLFYHRKKLRKNLPLRILKLPFNFNEIENYCPAVIAFTGQVRKYIHDKEIVFFDLLGFYLKLKDYFRLANSKTVIIAKRPKIYIACSCDNNFVQPLLVMLQSLIVNTPNCSLFIYILHNNLDKKTIIKITTLFQHCSEINLIWLKVNGKEMHNQKTSDHISKASYYRLLLPELLPPALKRVIYLDCDMVINESLEKLWNVPFRNHPLLAVAEMDPHSLYASSSHGLRSYQKLKIKASCRLFNAGVLVINLSQWRKSNLTHKILAYLKKYRKMIIWHDQDGMNAIIAGNFGELDPRWNQTTQLVSIFPDWKKSPLSKNIYFQTIINPYIVHFNTNHKPWQLNNHHPYRFMYLKYLKLLYQMQISTEVKNQ